MNRFAFDGTVQPTVMTVPGLNNSGPAHWQTLWEKARPETVRADLGMWDTPHRNTWVTKLDRAIATAQAPVILVGHSLGCMAIAWWAALTRQPYGWPVAGALLVAPADVDKSDAPQEIRGFAPAPRTSLPFPSVLVASSDDPWITLDRAHSLAADWGSHFVDAGAIGHINAASGLGWWPEGQELLERVIHAAGGPHGEARSPADARAILSYPLADRHPRRGMTNLGFEIWHTGALAFLPANGTNAVVPQGWFSAAAPAGGDRESRPELQPRHLSGHLEDYGGGNVDLAEDAAGQLVVAGGDGAVDLEVIEHALEALAMLVERPVMVDLHAAI